MIASARPISAHKDVIFGAKRAITHSAFKSERPVLSGCRIKKGEAVWLRPFSLMPQTHLAPPLLIGYSEVMVCVRSTDVWIFARHTR